MPNTHIHTKQTFHRLLPLPRKKTCTRISLQLWVQLLLQKSAVGKSSSDLKSFDNRRVSPLEILFSGENISLFSQGTNQKKVCLLIPSPIPAKPHYKYVYYEYMKLQDLYSINLSYLLRIQVIQGDKTNFTPCGSNLCMDVKLAISKLIYTYCMALSSI